VVGAAVGREQPPATVIAVNVEEARIVIGILDGFVHGDDPDQTHGFDLLVRKHSTDEASHFGIRDGKLALVGLGTNVLRDPINVFEEHTLEYSDFSRDTFRRLEVFRAEHAFGVITDSEAFLLEAVDPFGTGCAVGSDREVDDTILFAPVVSRFRNRQLTAEETECHIFSAELIDNGVQLTGS